MEIKRTLVLEGSEPVNKAAAYLDDNVAVIITKNGKYDGMIDHHSIAGGLRTASGMKCESVLMKPPVLRENLALSEQIDLFLNGHFKALPVIDENNKPLGVTTRIELLAELARESAIPKESIRSMMSAPVFSIESSETIAKAKNIMKEQDARRLVITEKGRPIGVISGFDISAWESKGKLSAGKRDRGVVAVGNIENFRVSEFIRPDITVVDLNETVDRAAQKMIKDGASHVLVIDQKKLVGILSAVDIFRNFSEKMKETIDVQLSGLNENTVSEYQNIKKQITRILEKHSKSLNITSATVHVKEGKSNYTINLNVETNQGKISIKEERPAIAEALERLADELETILNKKKETRKAKPRVTGHR